MYRFVRHCLVILIVLGITMSEVNALEFQLRQEGDNQILILQGSFVEGDSQRFSEALRRSGRADEIWLHSPGGNVVEGLEIGKKIRAAHLATRIPSGARCASICAFAFLGGVLRQVDLGGAFIVHMFSKVGNKEFVKKVESIIKQEGPEGAMAVIMFIEQSSAQVARMQADYLLEMSVSLRLLFPNYDTSHDEGHSLSRTELVSYNIVNTKD